MDVFEAACACGETDRGKDGGPRGPGSRAAGYTPAGYNPPPPQGAFRARLNPPCGVGIVFQPDSSGALHVKSLAVGGPAINCLSGNVEVRGQCSAGLHWQVLLAASLDSLTTSSSFVIDAGQVGDVLHEIDGHVVYRKPVTQLAPLILGQVPETSNDPFLSVTCEMGKLPPCST
jgi:hypothetical protein